MDFENSLVTLKQVVSLPILKGTTDIYSYDQAYLFASDNKWMPRH
jgi:hypothetical protein